MTNQYSEGVIKYMEKGQELAEALDARRRAIKTKKFVK